MKTSKKSKYKLNFFWKINKFKFVKKSKVIVKIYFYYL